MCFDIFIEVSLIFVNYIIYEIFSLVWIAPNSILGLRVMPVSVYEVDNIYCPRIGKLLPQDTKTKHVMFSKFTFFNIAIWSANVNFYKPFFRDLLFKMIFSSTLAQYFYIIVARKLDIASIKHNHIFSQSSISNLKSSARWKNVRMN